MITIHTLLVGQPQEITDGKGTWRSAIFRRPVEGQVALTLRGLEGDQVADTDNHGSPDQAVCCHPIGHYALWNAEYGLEGDRQLGPGAVGENWTLSGATERDICVGDIYTVGTARVQATGPRFPCTKQQRKLQLNTFHKRTIATLRTGLYLRVLEPGTVQAGDEWALEDRRYPDLTVQRVNEVGHHSFDPDFARRALEVPELAGVWKYIMQVLLTKHQGQ
jgi:MOSC domain-containing protein YiiM